MVDRGLLDYRPRTIRAMPTAREARQTASVAQRRAMSSCASVTVRPMTVTVSEYWLVSMA